MYDPAWLGCASSHLFTNIFYPMLIFPYFFRAYRMKIIYDQTTKENTSDGVFLHSGPITSITMESNSAHALILFDHSSTPTNGGKLSLDESSSQQRKQSRQLSPDIASKENRLIFYFVIFLVPFLFLSIINYFHDLHFIPLFDKSCDANFIHMSIYVWAFIHSFEILSLFGTIFLIRFVWSAFSIKQELLFVAIFDIGYCVCLIGFQPNKTGMDDGILVLYLILMRGVGFFVISIVHPLYQTFIGGEMCYIPDIPAQDVIASLDSILQNVDACICFRKFMEEQQAQYLFDFWMEVELFKDLCVDDKTFSIEKEARIIFRKYFDLNAEDISAKSVQRIIGLNICRSLCQIFNDNVDGGGIDAGVFDECHINVFEHMEQFHYRLFLRSQNCKELLASVAEKEDIFRKLINQDIL